MNPEELRRNLAIIAALCANPEQYETMLENEKREIYRNEMRITTISPQSLRKLAFHNLPAIHKRKLPFRTKV